MRFVVVGGAGAMGRIIVRDLVETAPPHCEIVVADREGDRAAELALSFPVGRVRGIGLDVTDHDASVRAIRGATVVVNSVQYQLNLDVMRAALGAGAHYVDLGGLFHTTRKQLEMHASFAERGLTALLGAGAAPGITNVLARHAADPMETVREIHCLLGGVDLTEYAFLPALPVAYSLKTILEEFSKRPAVFTRGDFTYANPMSGRVRHRFPAPVGWRAPMFTLHSEVATLPLSFRDRGVREVTFRIAFDADFVDRVRFLRDLGMASEEIRDVGGVLVAPVDVVNQVAMSQSPPEPRGDLRQVEVVRVVVRGTRSGRPITRIADCTTVGMPEWGFGVDADTGCPASIAAQMIARGEITARGALPPEIAIPVLPFFAELERRKMTVRTVTRSGWTGSPPSTCPPGQEVP